MVNRTATCQTVGCRENGKVIVFRHGNRVICSGCNNDMKIIEFTGGSTGLAAYITPEDPAAVEVMKRLLREAQEQDHHLFNKLMNGPHLQERGKTTSFDMGRLMSKLERENSLNIYGYKSFDFWGPLGRTVDVNPKPDENIIWNHVEKTRQELSRQMSTWSMDYSPRTEDGRLQGTFPSNPEPVPTTDREADREITRLSRRNRSLQRQVDQLQAAKNFKDEEIKRLERRNEELLMKLVRGDSQ